MFENWTYTIKVYKNPKEKTMNQEFSNVPEPPKKKNTALIIAGVAAALLLCCCLLALGAFALLGPAVGSTFESIERDLSAEGISPESVEEGSYDDFVPSGGYGDDILRFDTWINVRLAAAFANCTIPDNGAARTEIQVLQESDSAGVWVERWTVPCDDGAPKSFTITFTPTESGGTDFSIQIDD
jgi:hypothetical protein